MENTELAQGVGVPWTEYGTKCPDPDLAKIIAAWPTLDADVHAKIIRLVTGGDA